MTRTTSFLPLALLMIAASPVAGQVSIRGGVEIGRAEHRVTDGDQLVTTAGTLFGAAALLTIRERFEIEGAAFGGHLSTGGSGGGSSNLDDHDLAEVQLVGGMKLRPWLLVQSGLGMRSYTNPLARQHWTTWRIGAEAHLPLAFDRVTAVFRGFWIPVAAVSGFPSPDLALSASIGMDWQGRRIGVGALYTMERYDFPQSTGARRLEQLSSLRVRMTLRPR